MAHFSVRSRSWSLGHFLVRTGPARPGPVLVDADGHGAEPGGPDGRPGRLRDGPRGGWAPPAAGLILSAAALAVCWFVAANGMEYIRFSALR